MESIWFAARTHYFNAQFIDNAPACKYYTPRTDMFYFILLYADRAESIAVENNPENRSMML